MKPDLRPIVRAGNSGKAGVVVLSVLAALIAAWAVFGR